MHELLESIIGVFDNALVAVLIAVALLIMIIDGNKYGNKKYQKELKIVRIVSISYIVFGIALLVILMVS